MNKNKEEIRFSPNALIEKKFGKAEKNVKSAKATKRAQKKAKVTSKGKYNVRIVDGVKYMTLK